MSILLSFSAHFLELVVSFSFFKNVFNLKPTFEKKITPYIVSFVLYLVELFAYIKFDSTIINIAVNLIVNFLIAFLFFNTKTFSAFASSAFLSAALTASEFLSMEFLSLGLKNGIDSYQNSILIFALVVIISRLLFFIISKISEYAGFYIKGNKSVRIPLFLLLYPITTVAILYVFWIISTRYKLNNGTSIAVMIAGIAILLSVFLTFTFYSRTSKKMDELYKEQSEAERIKTDTAYYSILDKQNETLKMITHDEKNHLLAIKSITEEPEVKSYIDRIYGEIQENSLLGNTNNKHLDLILNKYQTECDSYNIAFDYSIKTANLSFMESTDLISMMSNILDNAVESAKKSDEKTISLSINRNNSFDILTCNNSCDNKPESAGEDLKSTKSQIGIHGYGFKSIKRTAKKYYGEVEWTFDDLVNVFTITIVFPHKCKS